MISIEPTFDLSIEVHGVETLERRLAEFSRNLQTRLLNKVLKEAAIRLRSAAYQALSGEAVQPRSGRYRTAMAAMPPAVLPKRPGVLGVGLNLPYRELLGIPAKAKHYYPAVLEYGSPTMPPKRPLRNAVDRLRPQEIARIFDELNGEIRQAVERNRAGVSFAEWEQLAEID